MATLTGRLREKKVDHGKQWMKENAHQIGEEVEDYTFLKTAIGNKRIVWLGENGHGVKEHTILKTKVIRYLQQALGFKVIVFQNGLMECASSAFVKENFETKKLIQQTLSPFWQVEEMCSLFSSIQSGDLYLAGMDCKISVEPNLFGTYIKTLDVGFSKKALEKTVQTVKQIEMMSQKYRLKPNQKKATEYTKSIYEKEKQEVTAAIDFMQKELQNCTQQFEQKDRIIHQQIIERTLENLRFLLEIIPLKKSIYIKKRDEMMARNFEWICETLCPNEKIIVWAHNMHMLKSGSPLSMYKPAGALISNKLKEESYYIGLFMGEGEVANNAGEVYKVRACKEGSIEEFFMSVEAENIFVDFTKEKKKQWFNRSCIFYDLGVVISAMVPSKQFDGILFTRKVHAPTRWN